MIKSKVSIMLLLKNNLITGGCAPVKPSVPCGTLQHKQIMMPALSQIVMSLSKEPNKFKNKNYDKCLFWEFLYLEAGTVTQIPVFNCKHSTKLTINVWGPI